MVDHRTVDVLVRETASLGEGPCWSVALQRLLWLDIDGGLLHVTEPETGRDATHDVGPGVGVIASRADGTVALARRDAFLLTSLDGAAPHPLADIPSAHDEVMNDGACDPAGRFWAGTYAAGERPGGGRLYRLDPDGAVRAVLRGVTLSNGLGWSPDHRVMYYVDSATQGIDTFAFDAATGTIADRRPWVRIAPEDGLPDGLAVDHDGGVWIALWGGRAVRRGGRRLAAPEHA
jgi:sugar lactone lactonase YvrE